MKSAQAWLDEYGESHQDHTNKLIHWICVPLIVWSVVALIWSIPSPWTSISPWLNWAVAMAVLAQLWYIRMSPKLSVGIGLFMLLCLGLCYWVETTFATPLWIVALIIFVGAWIGQFIGHKIEGQKPSFFKDIQFLLIGPAWLMAFVYKRAGLSY
ncbi:MAG: Mpo1-like protein [Pseudomonadota bacterium]